MKKEEIFNQSVKSALKSGKKIIMLYGNCFVTNIKNRLLEIKDFNEKYFLLFIPASYQFLPYEIYEIPDKFLKACDVFIYQKLDDVFGKKLSSNYIISKLKSTCLKLSVHKFYFDIYFPQYSSTSIFDIANIYAYGTHPYFIDRNIELLYNEGKNLDEITAILNGNIYPSNYLKKSEKKMISIMKNLRNSLDICVSDYILNNYKENILFEDPCHPIKNIIMESVKKICERLEIYYSDKNCNIDDKSCCALLIYKDVEKYLGLKNVQNISYIICGDSNNLNFNRYVDMYIECLTRFNT